MAEEDEHQRESRRIIARMNAETDGAPVTVVQRATRRGRDHFAASDVDDTDAIEIWGTRIGRAVSLILFFGLLVYLVTLLRGG